MIYELWLYFFDVLGLTAPTTFDFGLFNIPITDFLALMVAVSFVSIIVLTLVLAVHFVRWAKGQLLG